MEVGWVSSVNLPDGTSATRKGNSGFGFNLDSSNCGQRSGEIYSALDEVLLDTDS